MPGRIAATLTALTASQQMGLSQLVYQMGVNLDEFGEFLKLINAVEGAGTPTAPGDGASIGASIVSGTGADMGPGAGSVGNAAEQFFPG